MELYETHILLYLQGKLSPEEIFRMDLRLQESAEFRKKFNEISRVYFLSDNLQKQRSIDTSTAWNKLSRRIGFAVFRQKLWNITRTAAAVLLPLFLLYQYALQPALHKSEHENETVTIVSAPGVVTRTILPDGTEVWLNAHSTLTYPQRFAHNERTVQLSGEAYFKVVSDKKHRFNVKTSNRMTVSAYGTEFNVNAYASENSHEVTLAKGNIEVSAGNSQTAEKLIAGEKAIIAAKTGEISVSPTDTYVETAWKDGKMVFRREKLDKIIEKLSRKFGVTIYLQGEKLKEYEYTATFTDETLEDILDLLQRSAPITYAISKQKQLENETFTRREVIIKSNR